MRHTGEPAHSAPINVRWQPAPEDFAGMACAMVVRYAMAMCQLLSIGVLYQLISLRPDHLRVQVRATFQYAEAGKELFVI